MITMVQTKKLSITYVFGDGRSKHILSRENFAKEFFYGFFEFKDEFKNIDFIEFSPKNKKSFINSFFFIFSKVLRKISKLSFFFENICTYKNLNILSKSKYIILTNDRIGISTLPLLLILKIFKKNKSTVIVMGLLAKDTRNIISHIAQRLLLIIFFKTVNNFIFLSKGEFNQAKMSFKKYKKKFYFVPFCIDTNFWEQKNSLNSKSILFIGNDGRREYDFAIKLAANMPEFDFTFVTSNINKNDIRSQNITLIEGQWNKKILSDEDVKNIYNESILTIIPIKDSYQPSGQSVALQSMSMGVPVLITETIGFWDKDVFKDGENIFFIEKNDINKWSNKIKEIIQNKKITNQVIDSSFNLVKNNYNTDFFYKELKEIIFKN